MTLRHIEGDSWAERLSSSFDLHYSRALNNSLRIKILRGHFDRKRVSEWRVEKQDTYLRSFRVKTFDSIQNLELWKNRLILRCAKSLTKPFRSRSSSTQMFRSSWDWSHRSILPDFRALSLKILWFYTKFWSHNLKKKFILYKENYVAFPLNPET